MSLIYPKADPGPIGKPRTHVLIVGVGEYPHLPGGTRYAAEPARYSLGLKQLTSPPVSAQAFANWVTAKQTTSHKPPKAPLGTIELLLSPTTYTDANGAVQAVEAATLDNVTNAFNGWMKRCDEHADNVGVFYYCGHGFEIGPKTYLLASDFGDSTARPWQNLIDFDISRLGFLADCKATTMLCFLDACREASDPLLTSYNVGASVLRESINLPSGDRDAPILKATRAGERAHGPTGEVSYFTAALIRCLESLGAAGPPKGSKWQVSTSSLGQAMRQLMRRTNIPNLGPGACDVGGSSNTPAPTVLHHLPGDALAMTDLSYDPMEAMPFAELSCDSGATPPQSRPPAPDPWPLELPAGWYKVGAKFQGGQYPNRNDKRLIYPPYTQCEI